ncbi:MAG: rbsA 1 [Conexibacter sp.]|nr:rbsA 1 [Conexibacter sp.]
MDERSALKLTGVSKRYGAVQAVAGVTVECRPGEIHAIVGENGSGKSTLLGMASGVVVPDEGHVELGGSRLHGVAAHDARHLGLSMVFQTRSLAAELTVADNLFATVAQRDLAGPHRHRTAWAQEALRRFDLPLEAQARTGDLSLGQQQMLEIVKALLLEPKVLLLDEPTTALGPSEIDALHALISELVAGGGSVLYVSHHLDEILTVAQRVTVMRDGVSQGTYDCAGVTEQELVTMMAGDAGLGATREAGGPAAVARTAVDGRHPALSVRQLAVEGLGPIDLDVAAGEIVGIAGAEGNGQRVLLEALAGLRPATGVVTAGDFGTVDRRTPRGPLEAGVMLLPGDRLGESMVPTLGVRANATMNALDRFSVGGFLNVRRERAAVEVLASRLKVRTPSLDQPVRLLSGGNQQKIVLSRPFLRDVRVVLADEPSQGVDVNARAEIYAALLEKASEGVGAVLSSSDPLELVELCDRVIVLSRGRIVRELEGETLTVHNIVEAIVRSSGKTVQETGEAAGAPATDGGAHTAPAATRTAVPRGGAPGSGWLSVLGPFALLTVLMLALGGYAAGQSPTFLESYNLNSLLLSALPLALVAVAQTRALVVGGFDISVGSTAAIALVVSSFVLDPGSNLVLGVVIVLAIGVGIGLFNGLLVTRLSMPPIVATIATLSLLLGLALILRPQPGGSIDQGLIDTLSLKAGFLSLAFVAVVVLAIVADVALHRSRRGLEQRFTGFDPDSALRVGIRTRSVQLKGYVVAAVLASVAGLFLGPQVGVGDPSVGNNYALASVAAAILGGASLAGGRGSYLGAVWAALFLSLITNVTTLLAWNTAISLIASGALTLGALLLYAWAPAAVRRARRLTDGAPPSRHEPPAVATPAAGELELTQGGK